MIKEYLCKCNGCADNQRRFYLERWASDVMVFCDKCEKTTAWYPFASPDINWDDVPLFFNCKKCKKDILIDDLDYIPINDGRQVWMCPRCQGVEFTITSKKHVVEVPAR